MRTPKTMVAKSVSNKAHRLNTSHVWKNWMKSSKKGFHQVLLKQVEHRPIKVQNFQKNISKFPCRIWAELSFSTQSKAKFFDCIFNNRCCHRHIISQHTCEQFNTRHDKTPKNAGNHLICVIYSESIMCIGIDEWQ